MSYASVADMVDRFGQAEMIRLSTPDGAAMVAVIGEPVERALDDASALIDTWLRKRYRMPLTVAPPEIRRACCLLARYDLSTGGGRTPSEQTVTERQETISWLRAIGAGTALLDLAEVAVSDESYATQQSRQPVYGTDSVSGAGGPQLGAFWSGGL
ncbi:MAG: gp436 family protein [Acidiphilium sp.]